MSSIKPRSSQKLVKQSTFIIFLVVAIVILLILGAAFAWVVFLWRRDRGASLNCVEPIVA